MKKLLMLLVVGLTISAAASAQPEKEEVKVKPTSTPTQRVHNTFSRNKRHKGYKVKTTDGDHKSSTTVNTTTGATKTKND